MTKYETLLEAQRAAEIADNKCEKAWDAYHEAFDAYEAEYTLIQDPTREQTEKYDDAQSQRIGYLEA